MSAKVREIFNFSRKATTPFSPSWNYYLAEGEINFDITNLKNEILSKEENIINSYEYVSDWGTKLGPNSLTSRSGNYNLLNFDNALPLRNAIKKFHDEFIGALQFETTPNLYVQSWANVMRKRQKIAPHIHNQTPYCYLSGHLCVQVKDTGTYYINPYTEDPWKSENYNGKMTLFPSWVKHYTDSVPDEQIRITIAFDILREEEYLLAVSEEKKNHWVKLS